MSSEFETYWIVDDVKITSYTAVKKFVNNGKTAIEVSAERQQAAADKRKRLARENAIKDAEIRMAAEQRAHERSPEGQQEAARRTALENPGGIVSGGVNIFDELDSFSPSHTNVLR